MKSEGMLSQSPNYGFFKKELFLERLGHASIQMTLDTYSHVAPRLQEAAALRFDDMINRKVEPKQKLVI